MRTTGDTRLPRGDRVLTREFEPNGPATVVKVTSQIVSFVGQGMIDGNRSGHSTALMQLEEFVDQV